MAASTQSKSQAAPAKAASKSAAQKQPYPRPPQEGDETDATAIPDGDIRKKEFVERVAERSGERRGVVRKVLEAAFAEMGETLEQGKTLNLPPLGKLSVNRAKETDNAQVIIAKLRRKKNKSSIAAKSNPPSSAT